MKDDRQWTVMVFMGATTFDGSSVPLGPAADADIAEMRAIGSADGRLNILVERHDDHGVRRYHIGKEDQDWDGTIAPRAPTGMTDGSALARFVEQSLRRAKHRPRDYSLLVLWGHSFDFAFGRKRQRDGTVDALDFAELGDRLAEVQNRMKRWSEDGEPPKLGIICFDSCELSTVEMARQVGPYSRYLLGSEIGVPIPGLPYNVILERLARPLGDHPLNPEELGSFIVRKFCEAYRAEQDAVSLTLLDLSYADEVARRVGWLALTLASAIGDPEALDLITGLFSRSQTETGRPYVDVADLCLNLARYSANPSIVDAARDLGDFLLSPQPSPTAQGATRDSRPFVVDHGRNAGVLARLNGVSLYAPNVAPEKDPNLAADLYRKFLFAQQTRWHDLVLALARG